MTMNSLILNQQWQSRPDDERFLTVAELHAANCAKRQRSYEKGVALDHLRLVPVGDNGLTLADPEKAAGQPGAALTHWSFGQLCQRVHAPAGYLRTLPAALAAIPLQYSLEQEKQDAKLLARKNGVWTLDSITSDSYGRIWDVDVSAAVLEYVDLNTWKVPSASYASRNPKKATTLYASDRDMFICLVDDSHPITVPGKDQDTLHRGFIVRNSEVGAATLEIMCFLYRYICDNRIIWGMAEAQNLKIRHTSGGPMRFVREAQPAIKAYLNANTETLVDRIKAAQTKTVGKTEADVRDWLTSRGFTKPETARVIELAREDESDPRSVWGLVQGATAAARDIGFGDERLDLERRASKLLEVF
jgi:hypothetical protein